MPSYLALTLTHSLMSKAITSYCLDGHVDVDRVVSKSISVHAGLHSHLRLFEVNCDMMLSTQVESLSKKDSIQFCLIELLVITIGA